MSLAEAKPIQGERSTKLKGEAKLFKKLGGTDILMLCILILLLFSAIPGVCSFATDQSYEITNQYGDAVKIYGNGIYAHDSYNKATILIGTDLTVLLLVVPMFIYAIISEMKNRTIKSKLFLISVLATVLYYSASLSFGVTYNSLHLIYIELFSSSLFGLILLFRRIGLVKLRTKQTWELPSTGITIFLILSGISLFVAWLPDIIPSLLKGISLSLIEVYTTEITYVLDMGIISPLMFICLYLLKMQDGLGDVLLAIILKACSVIGIMLIVQSVVQYFAGIVWPLPVIITKVGIFVALASFAVFFDIKLYRKLEI